MLASTECDVMYVVRISAKNRGYKPIIQNRIVAGAHMAGVLLARCADVATGRADRYGSVGIRGDDNAKHLDSRLAHYAVALRCQGSGSGVSWREQSHGRARGLPARS